MNTTAADRIAANITSLLIDGPCLICRIRWTVLLGNIVMICIIVLPSLEAIS
jgi:hypothetical protein